MDTLSPLKQIVSTYLVDADWDKIEAAYHFAKEAHGSQLRYTGEPYITHPLAVALILAEMRMDTATIMAALLHDVVEDTAATLQNLTHRFGKEVSELVDGVTKLKHVHYENHAEAQAENFRKMILGMSTDIRIILVKLADRLHNMRTIQSLPNAKKRRIALETLEIFAPIANRLGMHAICVELEDLGFAARYPVRYRILKEAVNKARGNRQEVIEVIRHQIQNALDQKNLSTVKLAGRGKHLYSIYRKMQKKHLSFSEIMDVYAFRVITNKLDTCYRILGILHNLYKPIVQRFKDYIAIPKVNGYQSLHTTLFGPYGVPIEVQIRTDEMHKMAENGIAAHWLYKSDNKQFHVAESRTQKWLKSVMEMDQSSVSSNEFLENMKFDLFPDEVYVFTPKGRIIELPAGATPIDFAYAIHSDIGNTCVAVRLDKRLAPLSTPLVSGQQVEIITAPGTRPNAAWLNFVTTGRARSRIRHYLKKQQREESVSLGKRLLEKALSTYRINLSSLTDENWQLITRELKLDNLTELFEDIGISNRPILEVTKQIIKLLNLPTLPTPDTSTYQTSMFIKGTEGLVLHYAQCCRPIPGDDIVGLMQPGKGVEVHLQHCPYLDRQAKNSLITLAWEQQVNGEFPVDLRVELVNRRGSLASVTLAISECDANIENIHAHESNQHQFALDMTIAVRDRTHLARILRKIRRKKDVIRASRLKPILPPPLLQRTP